MTNEEEQAIDSSQPNFGRIYDFVLGGHHNFEADRRAAAEIMKVFPPYPQWARLNRWFLQVAALRWAEQGLNHVLDLGSGLPTQGHFHDTMPYAKVFYSDHDRITAVYAKQILAGTPHVIYHEADVRHMDPLLAHAADYFGATRKVGVGCIGLSYVLNDEELKNLAEKLAEWTQPGSSLAVTYITINPNSAKKDEMVATHKKNAKMPAFFRTTEQVVELMKPWELEENRPLEEWLEVSDSIEKEDRVGADFQMSGAFFRR